jgi:DinB superfamily
VSMAPVTPYSAVLGDDDPLDAIRTTVARITVLAASWSDVGGGGFERSYAPGKWTARQIVIHLAHAELAFGTRVRMALSVPGYLAQPFDQDAWMRHDQSLGGVQAAEAFLAIARMNLALYAELSPSERQRPFAHPEYGELTVDYVVHQSAGHVLHHLAQLETIGSGLREF